MHAMQAAIINPEQQPIDRLYFDGRCPICLHEINLLRKLKDQQLSLIDIHSIEADSSDGLPDRTRMLELLHLQNSKGKWVYGLEATVQAWSHTKAGWLFRPLRWPGLKHFFDYLYIRWASKRVCRLDS